MSLSFYSILRGLTGTQFPVLRDGKKMNAMSRKKKEEKAMNSSIYIYELLTIPRISFFYFNYRHAKKTNSLLKLF